MMITSAAFRKIHRATFAKALLSNGFAEQGGVYVRTLPSGQMHYVQLAAAKYGGAFTVDLGFHFSAVPAFAAPNPKKPAPLLDACCFQMRLRKPDGDQFFTYGESAGAAEALLLELSSRVLAISGQLDERWGSGRALLDAITPAQLLKDAAAFDAGLQASLEDRDSFFQSMFIRQLFPGWQPHVFHVAILLAFLSASLVPERAGAYVAVAEELKDTHLATTHLLRLLAGLLRAARGV